MARIWSGARPEGRMTFLSLRSRASYQYLRARQWPGGQMSASWGRIALLASALPALAAMQPPQSGQNPPPAGISVEYLSWGYLTASWQVAPNGDGEVREVEYINGFGDNYDVRIRHFHAGPEGFARLRALMERVRRFAAAGREYDCRNYVTDGPYGALRWNIGGATGIFQLT